MESNFIEGAKYIHDLLKRGGELSETQIFALSGGNEPNKVLDLLRENGARIERKGNKYRIRG